MAIQLWPNIDDPQAVTYAIVGRHPAEDLHRYPNLKAILALSAGVEQFRSNDFPQVPIVRLNDPAMSNEMAAYALHWILHFQRRFDAFAAQQKQGEWRQLSYTPSHEYRVGILGFGTIGRRLGEVFASLDYPINAWSRGGGEHPGVDHYAGLDGLDAFLKTSDAIINVLPSTPETRRLMNSERFAHVGPGAVYLTMGRGDTTDAEALIKALDAGRIQAAVLDVLALEPLPPESPLWTHARVRITPHVAGYTQIDTASAVIAANIRRLENGQQPFPILDTNRGY